MMLVRVPSREHGTTLAIDDDLLDKAQAISGIREKSALVREALKALIEREAGPAAPSPT
jgi:Arc/MetJ family transcription regulator